MDTVDRNTKNKKGEYVKLTVQRPTVIAVYNHGMGGVDLADQLLSYYKTCVRTKRWFHRLLFHMFHICANNSHLLMKISRGLSRGEDCYTLIDFLMSLINDFSVFGCDDMEKDEGDQIVKNKSHLSSLEKDFDRLSGHHFPFRLKNESLGKCKLCNSNSSFMSKQCGVSLCIQTNESDTCWNKFHSTQKIAT